LLIDEKKQASLMSEIVVAGYPLGKNFKATPGFIQAFQNIETMGLMIDLSAILAPGNSGGPIFNSNGKVLGIATATIQGYNFNLAIPVENLRSFLEGRANRIEFKINSNPEGSRVFLDGDYKGETPVTLELINGKRRLYNS
jgi:S1-C subfamily serine protease